MGLVAIKPVFGVYNHGKAKYKIIVFQITGQKILGRIGTHIFFVLFFLKKNI